MKIRLLIGGLIIGLLSCRPTNYVGHYELRHFPKSSIELKSDGTFEFTKINPNPYLHPFTHADENYFITSGQWGIKNNKLVLNSFTDSIESRQPEIIENRVLDDQRMDTTKTVFGETEILGHSIVTFYDIFNDTVDVLRIQFPNGKGLSQLHGSMRNVDWFTQLSDTAEFLFYGYRPYTFIRDDKKRREMRVRLYPEYQNSIFTDRQFIINGKRIKDHRIRFDKKKTTAQQNVSAMVP
jgi:hypothetical protein